MARYDFRCRTCGAVYEERRPVADADAPATCPQGHVGAVRLLPVFAFSRGSGDSGDSWTGPGGISDWSGPGACGAPVAGGCGAGCACHAG